MSGALHLHDAEPWDRSCRTVDPFTERRVDGLDAMQVRLAPMKKMKAPFTDPLKRRRHSTSTPQKKHTGPVDLRSEEHTSELQSQSNLVCRLLLEKKKKKNLPTFMHIIKHSSS